MDELNLVRELRPAPQEPGPEVVSAARARMWHDRKHRGRVRLRAGVAGLAACATGAAVTVALLPSGPPVPAAGGLPVFALPSGAVATQAGSTAAGQRILLTAAQTVVRGKALPARRYWEIPAVAAT
jgi:hypothetical protein